LRKFFGNPGGMVSIRQKVPSEGDKRGLLGVKGARNRKEEQVAENLNHDLTDSWHISLRAEEAELENTEQGGFLIGS